MGGLPWTIGAVVWRIRGRTPEWVRLYERDPRYNTDFEGAAFMVESGNIIFVVWIFCAASAVALVILHLRRKWLGCELGGPWQPKVACSLTFVIFWAGFVGCSSWRALTWREGQTTQEMMVVIGPLGLFELLVAVVCVWVMFREKRLIAAEEQEVPSSQRRASSVGINCERRDSSAGARERQVSSGSSGERSPAAKKKVLSRALSGIMTAKSEDSSWHPVRGLSMDGGAGSLSLGANDEKATIAEAVDEASEANVVEPMAGEPAPEVNAPVLEQPAQVDGQMYQPHLHAPNLGPPGSKQEVLNKSWHPI